MLRKIGSFVLTCLLAALPASAQKVGVVMSGGGAKGLYHIGVLEALEENGVPIPGRNAVDRQLRRGPRVGVGAH